MTRFGRLTDKIIGAAIDVHRELGPGLLESTYEACMLFELADFNVKLFKNGIRRLVNELPE
jgi:GxxExxY protein